LIDFPPNPTVGQTIQVGNTIYKCVLAVPAVWSATVATSGIPDAPADGSTYGRLNGGWSIITKTTVGLANVDNTSDLAKPISTATQTALNGKEPTIAAGTASQYWRGTKVWATLDKTAVGLENVQNAKQVVNGSASNTLTQTWTAGNIHLRIDSTDYGNTWPMNISGLAANSTAVSGISGWNYSNRGKQPTYIWATDGGTNDQYLTTPGALSVGYATVSNRCERQDRCGNWGFASGNADQPYMRLDDSGNIYTFVRQLNNDRSVSGLRQVGNPGYMEVSGSNGAFSTPLSPSDERLKFNILTSSVNASAAVKAMRMIEFDMGGEHNVVGFSAQNLKTIDPRMVFEVEQPEDSPMHTLGTVLGLNNPAVTAYLAKAIQEMLARLDALEAA